MGEHLQFYYERYYGRRLNERDFGCESISDVLKLAKDTVFVNEKDVLESQLDDEMECMQIFVKLAEEDRRERSVRLDIGDETAKLKIWTKRGGKGWDGQKGGQQQWQQGGHQQWQQGGQQNWKQGGQQHYGKGKDQGKGWGDNSKGGSYGARDNSYGKGGSYGGGSYGGQQDSGKGGQQGGWHNAQSGQKGVQQQWVK